MTEDVSQRFVNFDQWSTQDAIEAMYEGQLLAIAAIKTAVSDIAVAAEGAAERLSEKGRLVYVGAGTSGRIAVQDGAELGPTFGWPQERMVFCLAGGMEALTISAEGAEDDFDDGIKQIREAKVGKNDVVFGVAASGKTPFTLGALKEANALGAMTIGITNNPHTPILEEADYAILAETGSELIAGSTRMKAGTSQKAIFNMLSTAIMTRLGRIYKGFMVDMIVSNKKLENRAVNMICDITDCSAEVAGSSLKTANRHIKTAILITLGENLNSSERILAQAGGNLREALVIMKSIND
ncbi:MAG: N-acetylmuramic acid 6-phosphate etherase [Alphaproteobacteria bacterium]|nr:MAG: N-acetylmuramic acid 6-phosphate etherase [Alphaproteobacteria bacterium]